MDKQAEIVDRYTDEFRQMIMRLLVDGEDVLYEDDDIICFTNPSAFGMIEVDKSSINKHIDECIEKGASDCIQNLLIDIRWTIAYWGNGYTCDEADEFLIAHGREPYSW